MLEDAQGTRVRGCAGARARGCAGARARGRETADASDLGQTNGLGKAKHPEAVRARARAR